MKSGKTMMCESKACVLIPSYNEAKTIGSLVSEIKTKGLDVVVVDDGSTDATGEIAKAEGATLIRHNKNEGKGASIRTALTHILERDCDVVIIMDGDGQHNPQNIPQFLALSSEPDVGVVLGNRMLNTRNMPLIRWLTNKFMSFLISIVTHQRIPDSQCGYRLIKREVLEAINLYTSRFEIESEILLETSRCGYKIASIPIETIYRNETSRINPITDTLRFIKLIIGSIRKKNLEEGMVTVD